jgi:hypothetical protein
VVDLDRLDHRLRPALASDDDHRVADVRPDLEHAPRPLHADEAAHELRDLGIGNRLAVLLRELLHVLEQRVTRREQRVQILRVVPAEDGVNAILHDARFYAGLVARTKPLMNASGASSKS